MWRGEQTPPHPYSVILYALCKDCLEMLMRIIYIK